MSKDFRRGLLAGVVTAALVGALGVTALAVSRTITVDDDIRITVNGAAFTPKDVKGKEAPLFTHNGTTYAPLRAICEAAGLTVGYDSATKTATVTTPAAQTPASPRPTAPVTPASPADYITEAQAKGIALAHAGVAEKDAAFIQAKLEWDDGRAQYDVEFYAGNTEYDYDIDAVSGGVLTFDHDVENFQLPSANPTAPAAAITEAKAKEIALAKAPVGATVVKCELDWDDGVLVYELELRYGFTEYDCEVDAATGTILSWDVD